MTTPPPVCDQRPAPLRLLVVEDNNLTRRLLVRFLVSEGFEVVDFPDGASAIEALATAEVDIALVDLDLGPGPNGIDVLRAIRRDHQAVGAVVLSSFSAPQLADPTMAELPPDIGHLVKADLDSEDKIVDALLTALAGQDGTRPQRHPNRTLTLTRSQAALLKLMGVNPLPPAERHELAIALLAAVQRTAPPDPLTRALAARLLARQRAAAGDIPPNSPPVRPVRELAAELLALRLG